MKKILSLVLTLALLVLVSVPALANNINNVVVGPNGYVTYNNGVLPYIEASKDGGETWAAAGTYVNDWRGERVAFSCRNFLFPLIPEDKDMSKNNWTTVEETPVFVKTIVPSGTIQRNFAYRIDYDNAGVIASSITPGEYSFTILNGEVVIWLQNQMANANSDLLIRILLQSENGNFDVKHELSVKWVTPDVFALLPSTFITERGIKTIPYPKPVN